MLRQCVDRAIASYKNIHRHTPRLLDTRIAVVCKPGGSTTGRGSGLQLLLRFVERTHDARGRFNATPLVYARESEEVKITLFVKKSKIQKSKA